MPRILSFSFIRNVAGRLLNVKSARGVSFTLSMVALSSKPLGYLRMLITAWAFGTSPGMDAFHLASGIISLFAGTISGAMDSAILPELEFMRKEDGGIENCRTMTAFIAWVLMFLTVLLSAAMIIAPGVMIRFFAGGFDAERIRMGAVMLWWLLPFTAVTMLRPLLEVWGIFTERYTVSGVSSVFFNFVAIPLLVILIPIIGVYSVAASISAGNTVTFVIFLIVLRGVPLRFNFRKLPFDRIKNVAKNTSFLLVLTAAGTLFVIVDRYFASRLPSGSVAAISYAYTIIGIISLAATTPTNFFLARIARAAAESRKNATDMALQAMSILIAYFLPVSLLLAASARPIVTMIYGWGNFDAKSVAMTSVCITAYSFGIIFSLASSILGRYAQSVRRLGAIVALTYLMVAVNALLDYIMINYWGLFGLALATSISQFIGFTLSYMVMIDRNIPEFFMNIRFFPQLAAASACAGIVTLGGALGLFAQLSLAVIFGFLYFFLSERIGLMSGVPEHWRPSHLALYFCNGISSLLKTK